jgi:hypothetical protein
LRKYEGCTEAVSFEILLLGTNLKMSLFSIQKKVKAGLPLFTLARLMQAQAISRVFPSIRRIAGVADSRHEIDMLVSGVFLVATRTGNNLGFSDFNLD